MKTRTLALAVGLALAASAHAAVTYNEDGEGFVGKGDVQSLYDWNNSMLQENYHLIEFRMLSSTAATWTCTGLNGSGRQTTSTHSTESEAVGANVNYDARKNRVGQVTGFVLTGSDDATSYESVGACPNRPGWQQQATLDEGSLQYEGNGEPMLQLSIDGSLWIDLPITE